MIPVPGGFGERGVEGKITTARPARRTDSLPGHPPGMQVALIDHVACANMEGANSPSWPEDVPIRWWC
ncbi:hypothetical protein ACLK19_18535 [Escherichia coli]